TRFSRDWSSDVCSSDLPKANIVHMSQLVPHRTATTPGSSETQCLFCQCVHEHYIGSVVDEPGIYNLLFDRCHTLTTVLKVIDAKIGRASCRERALSSAD